MALKLLAAIAALGLAAGPALAEHHGKKEMAKGDIVDTAVAAGQFTTLVAAVQAAGLEDALRRTLLSLRFPPARSKIS
jgi:uncharacterized surface protein with fasciclin (FAS1) repeats